MLRVLVVDNNITMANLTGRAIKELGLGARVNYTLSTTQALFYLASLRQDPRRTCPDMIVMSDALPDATGPDALRALSDAVRGQNVILLVVLSKGFNTHSEAHYYRRGASALIPKPKDLCRYLDNLSETVRFVAMVQGLVPGQPQFLPQLKVRPLSAGDILQVHL